MAKPTDKQTTKRYRVEIRVDDGQRDVRIVDAPDEWKARTRAMAVTPLVLRGQSVGYAVTEV